MKGFVIFLILLILCCCMFPKVDPEDIGESFIGEDGMLSRFVNFVQNISDMSLNFMTDPLGAIWDMITGIFEMLSDMICKFLGIDNTWRPPVTPGSGDGHGGSGFEGGGGGFGGGMGSR